MAKISRFSTRIKKIRQQRGLTASQLGAALGKSEGAIRSWETGKAKPDADTLVNLSRFFHVSIDYLLGESNIKASSQKDRLKGEIATIDEEIQWRLHYEKTLTKRVDERKELLDEAQKEVDENRQSIAELGGHKRRKEDLLRQIERELAPDEDEENDE